MLLTSCVSDDYFLSNVKTIDEITGDRKRRLLGITPWPKPMINSVETWPCYNILSDLGGINPNLLFCVACHQPGIAKRMILYGDPYNPTTVEQCQPDPRITFNKVSDAQLSRSARNVIFGFGIL